MQSFVWKPGVSISAASLGNGGVIDTHNQFDQLEATDSGWEYQPYELTGSRKRPKRRRLVPKCTGCACSVCCALGICALVCPHGQAAEQEIRTGTPLRRTAAEHREHLTRQVEEDFVRHGFRGLACAPKCSSAQLAVATASNLKALLDATVLVECPNGEEAITIARSPAGRARGQRDVPRRGPEHQSAHLKLSGACRHWQLAGHEGRDPDAESPSSRAPPAGRRSCSAGPGGASDPQGPY